MSVTKALRGQKHLRSSEKPQKRETGGAEPPGPEYRLTPAARSSHALFGGSDTTEASLYVYCSKRFRAQKGLKD